MKFNLLRVNLSTLVALCLILPCISIAQTKTEYSSLEDALRSAGKLYGNPGPQSVNWTDGGNKYSYTNNDEIRSMDPKTLRDELIFANKGLKFPGSDSAFHMIHSNGRMILSIWFLNRISGRYTAVREYPIIYIYDLAGKQLKTAAKNARSAELSPDGSKVGMERNGNMYVYNFATAKEIQLTNDQTDEHGTFNGHYDWVYEEEFGQAQAWNWSPDSKYMAFWQFDERKVPDFQMTNYEGMHPDNIHISIPQVGDANPSVKIGVLDVTSGNKVWLTPDETGDFYIPRVYWTSTPDVIALMTLNRAQNHMKLYFFNVKTGEHHVVMDEQNNTWVAIFNFYTNVNDMIYFPEKSKEFFWVSDRSGYYHIYRYGYDGKVINQVTNGNWDMIKVTGIDAEAKKIYYLSAETGGLDQMLWSINFDGSNKTKLSTVSGYHDVNMSPNTKYFLDSYSNASTPLHVALSDDKGKVIKMLEENNGVSAYTKEHVYFPQQHFEFQDADGVKIDGYFIKPYKYDPNKKYPLVMTVYGGPESHDIFDNFATDTWQQWLAQNGYVVANINNRGVANYGSAFMKGVYKQLGKQESQDFVDAANYLVKEGLVDPGNMAIMGTSYGGFSTTYTMTTHPGVFKVGVANSPVTDWRLYDDVYTERYMAPLDDNKDGYEKSSVIAHAKDLNGHLLLIHSMSDDNVHPANTMQLLTALTNAGKDAELRIYPPGAHGAAYNWESYRLIQNVSFQYLEKHLKGRSELPNLNGAK